MLFLFYLLILPMSRQVLYWSKILVLIWTYFTVDECILGCGFSKLLYYNVIVMIWNSSSLNCWENQNRTGMYIDMMIEIQVNNHLITKVTQNNTDMYTKESSQQTFKIPNSNFGRKPQWSNINIFSCGRTNVIHSIVHVLPNNNILSHIKYIFTLR